MIGRDNLRRQMGKKNEAPGQRMDSRNDGGRKTRDREKQRRSERLRERGCEEK